MKLSNQNNLKLVRGARLLQAIEEDSTYDQLYHNIQTDPVLSQTKKRQHATGEVAITSVVYLPYTNAGILQVEAQARSNSHPYQPTIQFLNVKFEPNDTGTNVSFMGKDGATHYVQPIVLGQNNVKVRCTCLDYFYRFAVWNFNDNSLYGPKPPLYRKTTDRPPVNPNQVPGLCKHIIRVIGDLQNVGIVTR